MPHHHSIFTGRPQISWWRKIHKRKRKRSLRSPQLPPQEGGSKRLMWLLQTCVQNVCMSTCGDVLYVVINIEDKNLKEDACPTSLWWSSGPPWALAPLRGQVSLPTFPLGSSRCCVRFQANMFKFYALSPRKKNHKYVWQEFRSEENTRKWSGAPTPPKFRFGSHYGNPLAVRTRLLLVNPQPFQLS